MNALDQNLKLLQNELQKFKIQQNQVQLTIIEHQKSKERLESMIKTNENALIEIEGILKYITNQINQIIEQQKKEEKEEPELLPEK